MKELDDEDEAGGEGEEGEDEEEEAEVEVGDPVEVQQKPTLLLLHLDYTSAGS